MLRTQTRTMDAWDIVSGTAKALLPEPAIDLARKVRDRRRARRALAGYLARIGAAFPEMTGRRARLIDEGNCYAVVSLDDAVIFRFPRNGEADDLHREARFLDDLRPRTRAAIPDYRYLTADFGGYPMLKGAPLSPEAFLGLDAATQDAVLDEVADFLGAVHATDCAVVARPDGTIPHIAPNELFAGGYDGELRRRLESLVDDGLRALLERFYGEAPPPERARMRLVHGDLKAKHVFLVPGAPQLAVIDFGNVSAADPALDFAFLWSLGERHVRYVFERYALAGQDPGLVERSRRHLPHLGVERLLWRTSNPHRYSRDQQREALTLLRRELAAVGFADGH